MRRRTVVAGLAGLGAAIAAPALAQSIRRQSDPYGQVDPYADPRNGFSAGAGQGRGATGGGLESRDRIFQSQTAQPDISIDEASEIANGAKAYKYHVAKDGGLHPSGELQRAIKQFCEPFFKEADRAQLPWEVVLVNNAEINGWALPGGKVAIYAGLIAFCDHAGELAATVAHEIGHVDNYHGVRRDTAAKLLAMAGPNAMFEGVPLEALVPGASQYDVDSYFGLMIRGMTRENEFEADAHILTMFDRLGIDPIHAINDAKKFLAKGMRNGHHRVNPFVKTHPDWDERLAELQLKLATYPKPKGDYIPPGWDVLKTAFPAFKKA